MFKLIVSTLLCTLLCTINAEETPAITKDIKLSEPFSTTVADGTQLLTIYSDKKHIHVNSTDEIFKACEVVVDNVHQIDGRIKATMFGDKITVWGIHSKQGGVKTKINYSVLIVDPKQCTYKAVTSPEEQFLWFDELKNLPEVVVNGDSFDIYYSTMKQCTPCRYSADGKNVDLKQSMEVEPTQPTVSTQVKSFNGPELKNGYFYAHSYDDRTSVIKLYNSEFNVIKKKNFKHSTDVAAVRSGDKPSVTTCYATSIRDYPSTGEKVNCERFDDKLESVFSTDLPLLKKHDPAGISVAVDDVSGDTFVTVVESNEFEEIDVLRLYRLNSTGQVVNTYKLGEDPRTKLWRFGNMILRGFIFNKQYCFEVTEKQPSSTGKESVKCFAI